MLPKIISFLKYAVYLLVVVFIVSCGKNKENAPAPAPVDNGPLYPVVNVVTPTDPATAATIGFFMNDWQPKTFTAPDYIDAPAAASGDNIVTVDASSVITKIPTTEFGQNSDLWMTDFISQPIFMTHITNLHPHIIRFPMGSGSDVYFWNQPANTNPPDAPAQIVDKDGNFKDPGYGWGKTTDNWRASLDNYYAMLQQSNNSGIITVNYGYARYGTSANPVAAAAHLAADWVRYDKGRTQYWEVGNENYGDWEWGFRIDVNKNKDGQPEYLTGKLYAQHFKVFADSMRKAATEIGKTIYIGASVFEQPVQSWQTNTMQTWNTSMLPELNNKPDYYIVHNYFTPYQANSNAATILGAATSESARMMNFVTQTVQSNAAAIKPMALTEWNIEANGSMQKVSNTCGLFSLMVIGESIKNQFGLAARWDLLNGWDNGNDHGLFSPGGEPGGVAKWTPRPAFYYMYYFQKFLGDRMVPTSITGNSSLKAYASTYASGQANVSVVNTSGSDQTVLIKFKNYNPGARFYWYTLQGSNDNGEFSRKVLVNGNGPTGVAGGPDGYNTLKPNSAVTDKGIKVNVPALGAVIIAIDKK